MIRSFKCKETEKIFQRLFSKKLPRDIQKIAFRKLRMLNRSFYLDDLRIPPVIDLKNFMQNVEVGIAFVLMTSIGFASNGAKVTHITSKLQVIIMRQKP